MPEWKDFFDQNGMAWLAILYQKYNQSDINRLSNYLRDNAQTA